MFFNRKCRSIHSACPLFRVLRLSAIRTVDTSTVVHFSEEIRYWEGPLLEVPLYTLRKLSQCSEKPIFHCLITLVVGNMVTNNSYTHTVTHTNKPSIITLTVHTFCLALEVSCVIGHKSDVIKCGALPLVWASSLSILLGIKIIIISPFLNFRSSLVFG